MKTIELALH